MTDSAEADGMDGHHGDIMQQLLDHQRELREVVPPAGATRRLTPSYGLIDYSLLEQMSSVETVLDLTGAGERAAVATSTDRAADLRDRLAAIKHDVNDARRRAFDAVLALDDRLAEIERAVTEVSSDLRELG
jgi:hypothetical protein